MKKSIGFAIATVVLLAGCGGGGDRPGVEEITEGLTKGNSITEQLGVTIDDEMAECMAKAFHSSDLSDEALQAMVDGDEDYEGSEEDTEALTGMQEDLLACATPAP